MRGELVTAGRRGEGGGCPQLEALVHCVSNAADGLGRTLPNARVRSSTSNGTTTVSDFTAIAVITCDYVPHITVLLARAQRLLSFNATLIVSRRLRLSAYRVRQNKVAP